jgi:hypothetical protein
MPEMPTLRTSGITGLLMVGSSYLANAATGADLDLLAHFITAPFFCPALKTVGLTYRTFSSDVPHNGTIDSNLR